MKSNEQAKHTPGPWVLTSDNCEGQTLCAIVKEDDKIGGWSEVIGWINRFNGNTPQANARLIASAPDLLEACEAMVEAMKSAPVLETDWKLPGTYKAWSACVNAIRKAKGE